MKSLLNYDYMIAANPSGASGNGDKPQGHHVRLMPKETVTPEQLVEKMRKMEPALSSGTHIASLSALAQALGELMASGHAVTLPGVGTLQGRLTGTVSKTGRTITAQDVHFSGVQFTADAELLTEINKGHGRLRRRMMRKMPSRKDVRDFLTNHFEQNERLTRKDVIDRFRLTKYQTLNLLHELTENGILETRGYKSGTHYVLGKTPL